MADGVGAVLPLVFMMGGWVVAFCAMVGGSGLRLVVALVLGRLFPFLMTARGRVQLLAGFPCPTGSAGGAGGHTTPTPSGRPVGPAEGIGSRGPISAGRALAKENKKIACEKVSRAIMGQLLY